MVNPEKNLSRRQFIDRSIRGAGLCLAGGIALTKPASTSRAAGGASGANPFAYDIERLAITDPNLVKYEQVRKFSGLRPEPRRLAIGPQDHLYVATKPGLDILDGSGNRLAEIALSSPARCITVAEDGIIYVGLRTHVEVLDPNGQPISTWEPPTKKTWLTGLSVGASDVFAADSANRVIFRYDRSGKLLNRIGEKSQPHNIPGLIVPSPYLDVKLGRDGLLRVNNPGRHCVEVFTPNGDLEFSWGKPSAAIAGFCGCCNPIGLAPLPDGRWVTCEKGLLRVKVYSSDNVFDCVVAGPESFRNDATPDGTAGGLDAAVDTQGNVYILDLMAGDIRVMKPKA